MERWKVDFWPSNYVICTDYMYNGVIFKFDVEAQWQHFCVDMLFLN